MRDAEGSQRSPFDQVGQPVKQFAQPGVPGRDVVEARKDVRADHKVDVEPGEQALEASARIDAHVVAEPIADEIRRVVDERQQPEYEPIAQKETVGLEGIHAVGGEDDDMAPRSRTSHGFDDGFAIVPNVLDHFMEEDHVEGFVDERQLLRRGHRDGGQVLGGLLDPGLLDIHPVNAVRKAAELPHPDANAAANVQNRGALQIHITAEQRQSALLAPAPDVAGMTAQDEVGHDGTIGAAPAVLEGARVGQLDQSIARLRLFLAEIEAREAQVQGMRRQFRDQLERVITFALYREPSLDQTLAMMSDVEQREQTTEQLAQHLGRLHARVEAELESLQLTKGVEDAKTELAELEARKAEIEATGLETTGAGSLPSIDELEAEIRRLQSLINEASERAVQTLAAQRR